MRHRFVSELMRFVEYRRYPVERIAAFRHPDTEVPGRYPLLEIIVFRFGV